MCVASGSEIEGVGSAVVSSQIALARSHGNRVGILLESQPRSARGFLASGVNKAIKAYNVSIFAGERLRLSVSGQEPS